MYIYMQPYCQLALPLLGEITVVYSEESGLFSAYLL